MSILSTKAMLATLSISSWTARKHDRAATEEINKSKEAAVDASRVNKLLVPKDALAPIEKITGAARNFHYEYSMPWADNGARLLPAAAYVAYMARIRTFREQFDAAVSEFVAEYETHKEAARKQLGQMFREADYPTASDIHRRFSFSVAIDPVPAAEDFRVSIGDTQADLIRAEIEARANEQLQGAMNDLFRRVQDVCGRMVERLTSYKPGAKGERAEGTFRDSLVENVRDLAAILPALNVTGDARLNDIAKRMEAELTRHDAKDLREDLEARQETAKAAAAILADVSDFLA
ncbi:MAG: DUF3150 domain-containing protein [Caulobacterales bacterium]